MIQDDASAWFASQGQQIQDFEAPPAPEEPQVDDAEILDDGMDPNRPFGDAPRVTNEDVNNVNNMRAIKRPTAEVIVGTMDVVIPLVLAFAIKGSDREDAKLTPDERNTLVEAWADYLGDKNVAMSPSAALLVAMLTIYGSKVIIALTTRKEKNVIMSQQAEIEVLQEELKKRDAADAIRKKREEANNGH